MNVPDPYHLNHDPSERKDDLAILSSRLYSELVLSDDGPLNNGAPTNDLEIAANEERLQRCYGKALDPPRDDRLHIWNNYETLPPSDAYNNNNGAPTNELNYIDLVEHFPSDDGSTLMNGSLDPRANNYQAWSNQRNSNLDSPYINQHHHDDVDDDINI